MPLPREYQEQLQAGREEAELAARRATTVDLFRTCVHMVAWVLAGWVFIGFAAHTTNQAIGWVLYWTGVAVWIPGVLFSLLGAYRRGEKRGDW